jgi:hypothetical protein
MGSFLSSLLDKPVHDADDVYVGRLCDLAVSVASVFRRPLHPGRRGRSTASASGRWTTSPIQRADRPLGVGMRALTPSKLDNPGALVRETLLDKQIVDERRWVRVDRTSSSSGV